MLEKYADLLAPIYQFLGCETPNSWIDEAKKPEHLQALLVDHMHCELKAAQSAAFLIRKYAVDNASAQTLLGWIKPYEDFVYRKIGDGQFSASKNELIGSLTAKPEYAYNQDILDKMVRLIKEELHHFEQVLDIINEKGLRVQSLNASRYASGMIKHVRTFEPAALIDKLIIGAFIEARSCERFAKLAPYLEPDIGRFYVSLLRSEARHYQDYLELAQQVADATDPQRFDIVARVGEFKEIENALILAPDSDFKFHSGAPQLVA
ncbi:MULTISPECIES: tRNA isopentenyl-2-thiomethyl-A-37 hydroxylase MiaE [Pseudoalteromonas]|uniref:tRNA-(Ms[2]io[6]A)-hydroxylase n=1 Tax=Pseudoalteromonas rubra TaxID=43658 RepID=A0A5S3UR31_9GAMM|nr:MULTISPECIES: tRNA isopentenyl-2-thiomethyl-A-37 hydroxylase MiaE [Pseudoalteromonas]MCG7560646.1 tRNA isopentenyl-2-thiomethyl-A-37 hydroxylase MiaE [Pseudoalteromonas sp. McH1-42]MEC4087647.1 tRNA isopentenyl-2-thiomethyl-A-37 hydroxylase MiaE [Pseudoalteromonas rubra]QPB84115.1 tRNA-(ms[2]io[6]A)-hydroxylase [Pseudoalteromonas rubra]